MIKLKRCGNCGACMTWNIIKTRWECLICGNAEEFPKKFKWFIPGYIN